MDNHKEQYTKRTFEDHGASLPVAKRKRSESALLNNWYLNSPAFLNRYYSLTIRHHQRAPKRFQIQHVKYFCLEATKLLNEMMQRLREIKHKQPNPETPILILLDYIILDAYFGIRRNRKTFYAIVKRILTHSTYDCIYSSSLYDGFLMEHMHWLDPSLEPDVKTHLLKQTNFFILEFIVKNLIRFYYKLKKTFNGQEIVFFKRREWSIFESKIVKKLIADEFIVETENSTGEYRGDLNILPKGELKDLNFRAIVSLKRDDSRGFHLALSRKIKNGIKTNYALFGTIHQEYIKFFNCVKDQKVFGVKLDLKDAYGHVDVVKLQALVNECGFLTRDEKEYLVKRVSTPVVRYRGKLYEWRHGLLQGDRLSGCLCELYIADLTFCLFTKFATPSTLFHRHVDDFIFCTADKREMDCFLLNMRGAFNIVGKKTSANFQVEGMKEWTVSQQLSYNGHIFDLTSMEVQRNFDLNNRVFRHKFRLWNWRRELRPQQFISDAMKFSTLQYNFGWMELTSIYNSPETVLRNIFKGFVFVAFKYETVVQALVLNKSAKATRAEVLNYNNLSDLLENYSLRIYKIVRRFAGNSRKLYMTIGNIRALGFQAFLLVFKQRLHFYSDFIGVIKAKEDLSLDFIKESKVDFNSIPVEFRNIQRNPRILV